MSRGFRIPWVQPVKGQWPWHSPLLSKCWRKGCKTMFDDVDDLGLCGPCVRDLQP